MDQIAGEAEAGPRMVDDDEIEFLRERVDRQVAEFVERTLFPADADVRMQLLVALGRGHERRQGTAVVPSDAGQFEHAEYDLT